MPENNSEFSIRHIKPGDKVTGLSLGDSRYQPLKIFLQKRAIKFHQNNLAKTYIAFQAEKPDKIIGYISIVCGEIVSDAPIQHHLAGMDFQYDHCPAVKIARLAVDQKHSRKGIGEGLVKLSIGFVADIIAPHVGCRFIIVDAKKEAVDFYSRKCGFTFLDTPANHERENPIMFLDIHKASASE